jgi:hypothetical protein
MTSHFDMSAQRNIGGVLDYRALANALRPTDQSQIQTEIRRLYSNGLKPRDISAALRIDLSAVLTALGAQESSSNG